MENKGKLRVLEVNKAYFPHIGGIESLVKQYAEGLFERAEVKVLVCRDDKGKSRSQFVNGIKVYRSASFGTYFSCPLSVDFIRKFRWLSKQSDCVHINVPFPLADLACLLSGYKGRVVVSWHSDIVKQKKLLFFYKPLMMRFLKRADVITVATQNHIDSSPYISKYREKCRILPYGIDAADYLESEAMPILSKKLVDKTAIKVFFTGRLVYYKGVDVLIRAFEKVSGCELFIAGTGILENELKNTAQECKVSEKVHFMGFMPEKELKAAFRECDIFVLPSVASSEAFGIVQLEAMVYSKPVINTSLPTGVPMVSIDGETGITVKPSDADELANAIMCLAKSPQLREKYGKAGYERVIKEFNNTNVIETLYGILDERKGEEKQ